MARTDTQTCHTCIDHGYCIVHWGDACKRQGGKRIPRMKTAKTPEKLGANKQRLSRSKILRNKDVVVFEPIRTKVTNW